MWHISGVGNNSLRNHSTITVLPMIFLGYLASTNANPSNRNTSESHVTWKSHGKREDGGLKYTIGKSMKTIRKKKSKDLPPKIKM